MAASANDGEASRPRKQAADQRAAPEAKEARSKKASARKGAAKEPAVEKPAAKKRAGAKDASAKRPSATAETMKAPAKKAAGRQGATTSRRTAGVETAGTRPLISTRRTESTEPAEPPAPNVTVPRRPALAGDYLAPLGPEVVRQASSLVVSFESPSRQRRLTIAFRVFLALPHLVYLCVLAVVATLAAIVGWFCALVLGRLPSPIATLLGRIVQYGARVSAYTIFLLTDRYPPFRLGEPDYAVSVELAPVRLNRAALLFRFILLVPAGVLVNIVMIGYEIAAVFIWLIALVAGRLPTALFEGEAAVLRFLTRYYAYALLLTGEYPSGLFGDQG